MGACALAIGSMGASSFASAQGSNYPTKPIRFIVPFAAGGESDIVARHIANNLTRLKGYPVIVDNVPGAGGNLGVERGLREPADGYTFIVISGAYLANAIASRQRQDPLAAVQPVIQFSSQPAVLVASQKYADLRQLIDAAKKEPGSLNYGSAGVGSLGNFSMEEFSRLAGIKLTHIPYKGNAQAVNDLAMGQVDIMSGGVSGALAMARTGKVRILGTATTKRIPEMPDVPTLTEAGVPYVSSLWHGLIAAKGVPAEVIAKMNADAALALRDPAAVTALKAQMLAPVGGSAEDFKKVMAGEADRLTAIAAAADIRSQQ
jgi:tripartite-type tricarboxylate transporter receptor subunit TctC